MSSYQVSNIKKSNIHHLHFLKEVMALKAETCISLLAQSLQELSARDHRLR